MYDTKEHQSSSSQGLDTESPSRTNAIFGNTRGLFPRTNQTKVPYYADMVKENSSPFLCLTESHLHSGVLDAEIQIEGMSIYRSDRQQRERGGVVNYIREDLAVASEIKFSNGFCDILGLHIPELELALVTVYRPPCCPGWKFKEGLEEMAGWLRGMEEQTSAPTVLVSGDFNLGFLNSWDVNSIEAIKACASSRQAEGKAVSEDKKQALLLIDFAEEFFLQQYVDEGTRQQNILDLIFSNNEQLIIKCSQVTNSKLSDHNTICADLSYGLKAIEEKTKTNFSSTKVPEYDTRGADEEEWLRLRKLLETNCWETKFEGKSVSEMTELLLAEIEDKVAKTMKKKSDCEQVNVDQTKSRNKIPRKVRTLFRNKRNASDKMKTVKSVKKCLELRKKIEKTEETLKALYDERKSKLENIALAKIKRNPKAFYSYAKRHSKTFSGVGPFLKPDGTRTENSEAEELKNQYEKVFSIPKEEAKVNNPAKFFAPRGLEVQGRLVASMPMAPTGGGGAAPGLDEEVSQSSPPRGLDPKEIEINFVPFNFQDIRDAIDELSPNASAGPDGIPAILLKKCRDVLSHPLEILWRKSMETGEIPELFKLAHVCPLLKPGAHRSSPSSYRPVSLTSHLVKTFERVLKKSLQNHLEIYDKINKAQHGFRKRRSCLTQLLEHYQNVLEMLEKGQNADTVYLDFSKAFDKVDKGILCQKMKKMGICGKLGEWVFSFLTARQQVVLANGVKSSKSEVKSGVPQGTVLGPLLFLILINDISESNINSIITLFADDTRLTKIISSEQDAEDFQKDLEKIFLWSKENNMLFNSTKFELLQYGKNEDLKNSYNYLSPDHENIIERKNVLRDLGVLMNDDATFEDQINKVCNTVNKKAGWVLRTFSSRGTFFMKTMWKQLLQPHIDYCSQLHQPNQSNNLARIENLMKLFTKKISEVSSQNYWQRLQSLKMSSQQRRFERYRIIYIWKILEGKVENCGVLINPGQDTRRGRTCDIPPMARTASARVKTLREQTIQVNGARLFNVLPNKIRQITNCSVLDFKEQLDKYLTHIPDQPMVGGLLPPAINPVTGKHSNSLLDQIPAYRRGAGGV